MGEAWIRVEIIVERTGLCLVDGDWSIDSVGVSMIPLKKGSCLETVEHPIIHDH